MNHSGYSDVWLGVGVIVVAALGYFVVIPAGIDSPSSVPFLALAPAFWPNIIMGLLVLLGIVLCVQGLMSIKAGPGVLSDSGIEKDGSASEGQSAPVEQQPGSGARLLKALLVMLLLFAYYVGLSRLGFVLASMLILPIYMLLAGVRNILLISAISLLLPVALYYFFTVVAKVAVPLGVLESFFNQ